MEEASSLSVQETSAGDGASQLVSPTNANTPKPTEIETPKEETAKPKVEAERAQQQRSREHRHAVLESLGLKVGKTLGHGSYASVKAAADARRKEEVAIKIVSRRRAPNDYLSKFLPRELDILKLLQHESLIKFYQVIETTNRFYIVMELAVNGDLLDAIRGRVFVDEFLARKWFTQLQNGIVYIHSKGVAHRDIKCENILLDRHNDVKITDFGFAKQIFPLKQGNDLFSETFCGSYAYAAPEILRGIPYDPFMSEVWSMGVVLFTMVFGRLPFDDSDLRRLLKQVQSPVVFPSTPVISDQCRSLIQKILMHKVAQRLPLDNISLHDWHQVELLDVTAEIPIPTTTTTATNTGRQDNQELASTNQ